MINIYPCFSVPMVDVRLPQVDPLNRELRELLLRKEAEGAHANPNPSLKQQAGVFESDFLLFSWPDTSIQRLKAFCWSALGEAVRQLNGYSVEEASRLKIFSHAWYHVTRRGGFTILHTHPMASWSGVYCVDPGDSVADRPESGILRFQNPHPYSNYFMDPGNSRLQRPYHHGSWSLRLEAGQLVLFPSWLQHEVLPFFGSRERITVAFNCWFQTAAA